MKSQKGMTLVSVLVAVAVMGVVAATLASIYEGMSRVMRRTSMQSEVDNLQRFIQGVLTQKVLCDNALRQAYKGAPISWNYKASPSQPVQVIQLWDPKSGDAISVLASSLTSINPLTGLPYNQVIPGLTIDTISIQTPDRNGDGVPDPYKEEKVVKHEQTHYVVPAEIVISFKGQVNWSGGVLRSRAIPIAAVFDTAFNLKGCDITAVSKEQKVCATLQNALDDSGYTSARQCPLGSGAQGALGDCTYGPPEGITQVVFFDGYDSNNNPKCSCQKICGISPGSATPPSGTSPVAPPPVAPPPTLGSPSSPIGGGDGGFGFTGGGCGN